MTARPQHQRRPQPGRRATASGQANPDVTPQAAGFTGAASPEAMRWAHGVLADAVPALAGQLGEMHVLRNGPKRLAVLGFSSGACLVLKQYADDRGLWTRRWLQRLAEAGFAPPARFAVTPARGWSGAHRTLVTDVAPGHAWTHWLQASAADRDAAAVAAADWLAGLQSLPVALPDRTGYRAGEELRHQTRLLASEYPGHATRLLSTAGAAHQHLYGNPGGREPHLVASHGDLHPENLHVAAGGPLAVTAIDVDTAGLRRPSYDVGYALAQLLVVSWMRTGSFSTGAGAGLTFWRRWTDRDGRDADTVPAEVARALVQSLHFELITYHTGRTDLFGRWLDIAETVLNTGVPATFHALTAEQEVTP